MMNDDRDMKTILFLTEEKFPEGTADDLILARAFEKRGVEVEFRDWRDSSLRPWPIESPILIRSPWNYYRYGDEFSNWLDRREKKGARIVNPPNLLRWNLDKIYLKELAEKGIPIVETLFVREKSAIPLENPFPCPEAIFKPSFSAGAHHAFRTTYADWRQEESTVDAVLSGGSTLLIQPFLSSILEDGEISLLFWKSPNGPEFQHALLKTAKPGDYRVQGSFGGSYQGFTPEKKHFDLSLRVLELLPFDWFYARVDLVDWKTSPKLGEVELLEPDLFFRLKPESADRFVELFSLALLRD
jgi:glutathione synthase/RimK-type ligase-like ATP-grasp enzyme